MVKKMGQSYPLLVWHSSCLPLLSMYFLFHVPYKFIFEVLFLLLIHSFFCFIFHDFKFLWVALLTLFPHILSAKWLESLWSHFIIYLGYLYFNLWADSVYIFSHKLCRVIYHIWGRPAIVYMFPRFLLSSVCELFFLAVIYSPCPLDNQLELQGRGRLENLAGFPA